MDLQKEAESIEKYADDIQTRAEKYEKEEALRLETLQRSLRNQAMAPGNYSTISRNNRKSATTGSSIAGAQGTPVKAGEGNSRGRRGGGEGGSRRKGKGGGRGKGKGEEKAAEKLLKKTDSFKKTLTQTYFFKDKPPVLDLNNFQPSPKGTPGEDLEAVYRAESLDWLRYQQQQQQQEQQGRKRQQPQKPPPAFDFNRVFMDGVLFNSLDEEDSSNNNPAPLNLSSPSSTGGRGRTPSADHVDMLEGGRFASSPSSAYRSSPLKGASASSSSSHHHHHHHLVSHREKKKTEENEQPELPSGNCIVC